MKRSLRLALATTTAVAVTATAASAISPAFTRTAAPTATSAVTADDTVAEVAVDQRDQDSAPGQQDKDEEPQGEEGNAGKEKGPEEPKPDKSKKPKEPKPEPEPDPDEPTPDPEPEPEPEPAADSRVVVAVVDDPTNPYHDFFNDPERTTSVTPEVLAELGVDEAHTITLTRTGDFAADYAADADQFAAVNPGELYWFEGTNVFSITFDPGEIPLLPESASSHGVGTSSAVMTANPEAIVVQVEGINSDAETWAFTTPFVDVITTSYGFPGSPPIPGHLTNSHTGVVELGKVHTGAADNSPALSPPDGTSGPWWTLGIAGFHEDTSEGRENLSGNVVDFVSDFTQDLPYCGNCESGTRSVSGTSFATPRTAGVISDVILETRRAHGHVGGIVDTEAGPALSVAPDGTALTTWTLRRAMEEAAYYPDLTEYDAESAVLDDLAAAPVAPVAPYVQTGWGVVSPDEHGVVEQALVQLGITEGEATTKSAEACAFNTAAFEARVLYWDNLNIGSESFLTTEPNPYIAC